MVYKNYLVVAENLAKIPSSCTRIPSSFTNFAPWQQLRGWEIVETHNMIPGRLGNITLLAVFPFCIFIYKNATSRRKNTCKEPEMRREVEVSFRISVYGLEKSTKVAERQRNAK